MKIKIAVPARVSGDRKRCLRSCDGFRMPMIAGMLFFECHPFDCELVTDHLGRPLRCRACLRGEVRP